jgi:hypothetical protein
MHKKESEQLGEWRKKQQVYLKCFTALKIKGLKQVVSAHYF